MFKNWWARKRDLAMHPVKQGEAMQSFDWSIRRCQLVGLLCGLSGALVDYVPLWAPIGLIAGILLWWRYRLSLQRQILRRFSKTQDAQERLWLDLTPLAMLLFVLCLVLLSVQVGAGQAKSWQTVRGFVSFGALAGLFGFYGWWRGRRRLAVVSE